MYYFHIDVGYTYIGSHHGFLQKFCHPFIITNATIRLQTQVTIFPYSYSSLYNLKFNDEEAMDAVLEDVKFFREFGGGTIVENSNHGLKRDISLMKRVSNETGVNVITGTGIVHPSFLLSIRYLYKNSDDGDSTVNQTGAVI